MFKLIGSHKLGFSSIEYHFDTYKDAQIGMFNYETTMPDFIWRIGSPDDFSSLVTIKCELVSHSNNETLN